MHLDLKSHFITAAPLMHLHHARVSDIRIGYSVHSLFTKTSSQINRFVQNHNNLIHLLLLLLESLPDQYRPQRPKGAQIRQQRCAAAQVQGCDFCIHATASPLWIIHLLPRRWKCHRNLQPQKDKHCVSRWPMAVQSCYSASHCYHSPLLYHDKCLLNNLTITWIVAFVKKTKALLWSIPGELILISPSPNKAVCVKTKFPARVVRWSSSMVARPPQYFELLLQR